MRDKTCNHPACDNSYKKGYRLYHTKRGLSCVKHLTPDELEQLKPKSVMRPRSVQHIDEKDHETL